MADANAVIASLGQQLAHAIVDLTIAQVELAETRAQLAQEQNRLEENLSK